MNYIKQLDSLRAIAVLLVIMTHWFPEGHPLNTYTSFFNGVDIFFALSGFLITRILLNNRIEAEQTGQAKTSVLKNFFMRRTLRIFPVYYLLIAFLFIMGPKTATDIRENIVYFLTYTSNFYFYSNDWDGILSHLWSLSVEEQFYLLWPWLMLFTKRRFLLPTIILAALVGVLGQMIFPNSDILTFSCFDGFGIGALLAWGAAYRPAALKKLRTPSLFIAIVCCLLQAVRVFSESTITPLPSRTLTALCIGVLILHLLLKNDESKKFGGFLLNNKGLIFIGKISYGIYLYHLLIPHFAGMILYRLFGFQTPEATEFTFYLLQLGYFGLLLLMAYASWKLIEAPILKYKDKFAYHRPHQTPTVKLITRKETEKLPQR